MVDRVARFLEKEYHNQPRTRDALIALYHRYDLWGIKDSKFDKEFTDGRNDHFASYLWEMLLAQHLKDLGFGISSKDEGPDFKIDHHDQTIWIEAICPKPQMQSSEKLMAISNATMVVPLTGAIKTKNEVLVGVASKKGRVKPGYLEKGIVGKTDPYVIAVNSCRLGRYSEKMLHQSVSLFPYILEAVVPIGPIEFIKTNGHVQHRHTYRSSIKKGNGSDVPTNCFLDDAYAGVSAVLASPADTDAACGKKPPIALVHNPLATNKLPVGILGVDEEYVIELDGDEISIELIERDNAHD